jgi:hypothetical protein
MWRFLIMLTAAVLMSAIVTDEVRAEVVAGKVSVAGQGQIAIVAKNGDTKQFEVADEAKITLNGKPAKLSDIELGDVVTLTTKEIQGKHVVVVIDAKDAE